MAFFIESRFIDIRTLVDFSEVEQTILNPNTVKTEVTSPDPPPENQNDFQAIKNITENLVNNESQTSISTRIQDIPIDTLPGEIKPQNVDRTNLYTDYINLKYQKEIALELIRILLNPYLVNLAYRYDFSELKQHFSYDSPRIFARIGEKNSLHFDDGTEKSQKEQTDEKNLQEFNRKKDLERIMLTDSED